MKDETVTVETVQDNTARKQRIWPGVLAGWLTQLVFKSLLPLFVLAGAGSLYDSNHPRWYILQLAVALASCAAGVLAAIVVRGRYRAVATVLILLSLFASFFEQLPRLPSAAALLVWAFGPCVGIAIGVGLVRFADRRRQPSAS